MILLTNTEPEQPGLSLPNFHLELPVVTCEQAATAKNIPLANELKTIVLETTLGIMAVHIAGNKKISLRAVKDDLKCSQAFIAPPECLKRLHLQPGTVSAVLNPVWSMQHLIDKALLQLTFVSTNNGTLTGYFVFSPAILLGARQISVGEFQASV